LKHTIAFRREITMTLSWDRRPPPQVDAAWQTASGTVELNLRPSGAQLEAMREVVVAAEALLHFDAAASRLLDALTGSATLEPLADYGGRGDFAFTVTLEYGKGTLSGFVATTYPEARLTFEGLEIDQTYVAETQRQLRSLLDDR
jgi:hypothetical protein